MRALISGDPGRGLRRRLLSYGPDVIAGELRPPDLLVQAPVKYELAINLKTAKALWPAPGSEDTKLGVLMELEVRHGEAEVYA